MQKRILVVDDDLNILETMQFMLAAEGHSVTLADKGEYIEKLLERHGLLPDLIIFDVLLSGKDGRDIARKLKKQTNTRNIPVLMFSALPDVKKSVLEAGADDFLAKPFEIDDLLQAINSLTEHNKNNTHKQ